MNKDPKQRTGRTTRMLLAAIEAARAGRAVYVVGTDPEMLRGMARDLGDDGNIGLKFERISGMSNLDFSTGELRGSHPNCVVFVDHYAAARMCPAWASGQITRFDPEDPARAALARLVAAVRNHVDTRETMRWQPKFPPWEYDAAAAAELAAINELNDAFAEAERALEEKP